MKQFKKGFNFLYFSALMPLFSFGKTIVNRGDGERPLNAICAQIDSRILDLNQLLSEVYSINPEIQAIFTKQRLVTRIPESAKIQEDFEAVEDLFRKHGVKVLECSPEKMKLGTQDI